MASIPDSNPTLSFPQLNSSSELAANSDQSDWRAKACGLLEKQIDQLKQDNTQLFLKIITLVDCLNQTLLEISHLKSPESLDVINNCNNDHLIDLLIKLNDTKTYNSVNSDIDVGNKELQSLKLTNQNMQQSLNRTETKKSDDLSSLQSSSCLPVNHHNDYTKSNHHGKGNNNAEISKSKLFECDDEEINVESDPDSIRAAFRLFAKHIGPSLKREYRHKFNTLPTQLWLADQLLVKWDALSLMERNHWCRQVKFT